MSILKRNDKGEFYTHVLFKNKITTIHFSKEIVPYLKKKNIFIGDILPVDWFKETKNFQYYHGKSEKFINSFVTNAICPYCGQGIFFYSNENGSKVFFEYLGYPWDKHPCFLNKNENVINYIANKISIRFDLKLRKELSKDDFIPHLMNNFLMISQSKYNNITCSVAEGVYWSIIYKTSEFVNLILFISRIAGERYYKLIFEWLLHFGPFYKVDKIIGVKMYNKKVGELECGLKYSEKLYKKKCNGFLPEEVYSYLSRYDIFSFKQILCNAPDWITD